MKLNKIFLGLVGLAAMTLASCSSSDDYEWAKISGPQVFFSDELPSQYEIDPEATSFTVPISRADASGSLTVNLTATSENPMYTVPASVTFVDGQKEASIPVSYDPTAIEYGRYDNITISVSDAANGTPWGIQEFSFKAGVTDWGAWENWNSAGTADYIYTVYWEGEDPDLKFVYRHNLIKPNLYQFKLSNWGSGVDVVWDYDEETGIVSVAPQYVIDNSTYGAVTVADYCYYQTVVRGTPTTAPTGYFNKEQGILACPVSYYVSAGSFGADYEYIYIDGYVRADYTSSLLYSGIFTDAKNQVFAVGQLTAGADVTTAKAVVMDASVDADAVADAIADGDLEAIDVEPGLIYVPIPEGLTGALQLITVVVVDGQVKSSSAAEFEYYGGGANPWKSLGMGLFTDNCLIPLYPNSATGESFEPQTYEVEILEHSEKPGLYRLVNAFEGLTEFLSLNYTPRNLDVNATNANGVYILEQATGIDDGDGEVAFVTNGARYLSNYSVDELIGYGYLGSLQNGVITFPHFNHKDGDGNVDFTYQGICFQGDGGWYVGVSGDLMITLPEAVSASARAKARAQAKARDFVGRLHAVKAVNHKVTKCIRALIPVK